MKEKNLGKIVQYTLSSDPIRPCVVTHFVPVISKNKSPLYLNKAPSPRVHTPKKIFNYTYNK